MNCAEHKNEALANCPSCLAEYWKAQYTQVKTERDLLQNELDVIKPFAEEAAKWLPAYNKTVAERVAERGEYIVRLTAALGLLGAETQIEAVLNLTDLNAARDVLKEDNEKVYAALLDALSKLETSNRWVAKQAALIHKLKADLTNINHPKTR